MRVSEYKKLIERTLEQNDPKEAERLIVDYEKMYPGDADIIVLKTSLAMMRGDLEEAFRYSLEGVRKLPLNGDMQYNYGLICEQKGLLADAYEAYCRAEYIYEFSKKEDKINEFQPLEKATKVLSCITEAAEASESDEEQLKYAEMIRGISEMMTSYFGLRVPDFRSKEYIQLVGRDYYEDMSTCRYAGIFKDQWFDRNEDTANLDVLHLKAEFMKTVRGTGFRIGNEAEEYLVPVASEEADNIYFFEVSGREIKTVQIQPMRFVYYRLPKDTLIRSQSEARYGRPVPLIHSPERKRLVLNIFVDGLSNYVLRDRDFETNMPATFRFFSKGTIFTEAFNNAEWTYPSITSFISGLYTPHHMLFHSHLDYPLTKDVMTLPELFQKAGYHTAMFNGNWRIIPPYGHARGYDRFVFQHQKTGNMVQDVVSDVLNHLMAFSETDQFVWMSIGELHQIADYDTLTPAVQGQIDADHLERGLDGPTSVKQTYDEAAVFAYLAMLRHIDRWLDILYKYIEEHFSDEEIIVSLFSDHGQGYLFSREDSHFLAEERSNVPVLFRGGAADGVGECHELMSSLDFLPAMCSLCGVEDPYSDQRDGHLPEIFGGDAPRSFTLTESIHPGDPYQAAIYTADRGSVYYFRNPCPVADDGRFALKEYESYLENRKGERVENEGLEEHFLDVVLEHISFLIIFDDFDADDPE